jgi:hypothetical protein
VRLADVERASARRWCSCIGINSGVDSALSSVVILLRVGTAVTTLFERTTMLYSQCGELTRVPVLLDGDCALELDTTAIAGMQKEGKESVHTNHWTNNCLRRANLSYSTGGSTVCAQTCSSFHSTKLD